MLRQKRSTEIVVIAKWHC